MKMMKKMVIVTAAVGLLLAPASAQVGKSQGVVDVNTVAESQLAQLPHMTPAIAKAVVSQRPFASAIELNKLLVSQGLTPEQTAAFYGKAFVNINLNTATAEEIMLIPGAGRRMAREFDEYRPWKSYAQFDKEIGKYVDATQVARLAQYTFIPMNVNTASDADLMTIPNANQALVDRIKAGRPYKTLVDVETAVAKGATPGEGKRVARYLVIS
jgi:DNA uptake protein ComE-like DNA-binding protein